MASVAPARPGTEAVELSVVVRQLRWEAAGVVSVELCAADGRELPPWRPGAHIELVLPTGIARQYSLCGSPEERSCYRIGVLRERGSRGGSEYVHAFLRPGQPVRVRGPRDNFGFGPASAYLFIAGGIGITPILPMVREAADRGVPWQLAYGGRTAASMAFLDGLRQYPEQVWLYPEDQVGRIPLHEWLDQPRPGTVIYACGPEPLLSAVEAAAAHWEPGAVRMERFRAWPKPARPNTEIEVVCARSNRTVTVPADRSVLAALQDEGVPVTGSCREGVCGTCETRVLDGDPEHRDDILSEDDRRAGDRMFICVSRARGPRLVLDI
ncbi:PDR/VanB family oxidoreductase [Streptoalloteichus hindustanus]|uniref:Ferredoxin-NADP reductase n=1 Tax=Streptoalloteichus hindustanus TaxID=2017 RepID=A0A1M5I0H3_STRHI|nr:PDR/VanB family oxidoreductase [Streptoalloteichus hindustanus]SHG21788.1 Ferredoxin-NADP reductase [Streptoalloteichus hindustanus]